MSAYEENEKLICKQFERDDLSSEDILNLTIARKLNALSDNSFVKAMQSSNNSNDKSARKFRL